MKENTYDDGTFFAQYSRFPRSVQGLSAAGEWHALREMLPDFTGKRVLDLGCGFGWHCRYAAEQGAREVLGEDISQNMLERARAMGDDPRIRYVRAAMEDLEFAPASFEVVISSLAMHYVEDFPGICKKVWDWLTPGGVFVFSCEHPIFTADGPQAWCLDAAGRPVHWPVDRYFETGRREAVFLGCTVTKYHRTLTDYVGALLGQGFRLTGLVEPTPDPGMMDQPGMADELRRPMMLLLSAEKPADDKR